MPSAASEECRQCERYGVDCPGYTRSHKFLDEGPQLQRRFGKNTESIDERIAPTLAAQSVGKQQPVVFGEFVLKAFTKWFGLNRFRVHTPWTVYIAQHGGQSAAFDTAIFCVNSIFMGHKHSDDRLQQSSREMYSRALRLFGERIGSEAGMRSRESVSITIALSLFEAYSRTRPDSWAPHAAATALLMAHRGPAAHLTGFDRCLYLSFRSFLVAEAFVNGKHCLFDRPEWQAHIDQVRAEDMASPRVDRPIALFIDFQDRIFLEVARVPGFLVQARRLAAAPNPEKAIRSLGAQALRCSQRLDQLAAHLRLTAAVQNYRWKPEPNNSRATDTKNNDNNPTFIGPIPSNFPQAFANSVLRGADRCLYILRLLLGYLHSRDMPSPGSSPESDNLEEERPVDLSDPLPFRIVSKLHGSSDESPGVGAATTGEEEEILPADQWLDHVAASMGLEAFEVVTYAKESPVSDDTDDYWTRALSLR
ncbi:hypothetical protein NUU61_001168 [Penicillium alfredii]|uniref:Zn(2)-C6 fungal-type domain-containing protein n=1 Tax=Penicillium alfredii TaxID=1506179 RepID=A0A9W9KQF0_9EURO|nr:uncharacterized protein NUU61_001168 [Penicillium alfredii]KAJ5115409.1 hypothetical protein NUU61_001168 [Penicillium alfredii]